jgi:cold shock CspA family protein
MAETFNKREKEKKKLQKKKEKDERKADRKANKVKGQDWESMIAYMDENGNISSVPPDPTKKLVVNAEDIVLGARNTEEAMADNFRKGRVTFFNKDKGYGFIKDIRTQESIFVHINELTFEVKENDKVSFETERGFKGLNAVRVKKM